MNVMSAYCRCVDDAPRATGDEEDDDESSASRAAVKEDKWGASGRAKFGTNYLTGVSSLASSPAKY